MPFKAIFIEQSQQWYNQLLSNIDFKRYSITRDDILVFHGDHNEVLPKLYTKSKLQRFGLIYNDPSGTLPSFEVLSDFARFFPKVDILIYVSAANIKRMRKSTRVNHELTLTECTISIGKRHWLIREPIGRHQWTFLLGTNWKNFPKYKKIGFYHTLSQQGGKIITKLNYTSEELQEMENAS